MQPAFFRPLRRKGRRKRPGMRLGMLLLCPLVAAALAGCESLAYYAQAASGQLSLLGRRQPIEEVIEAPDTADALKSQLRLVLELREFARDFLQLPLHGQYGDYADLQRDFVVWNVLAAPELSLQEETWCFPLVGCVAYRGYFSEGAAREFAGQLVAQGFDTHVTGVAAYSTLGWMRDPVLNTFVMLPEPRLADLIFHELAHQLLFIPGDTLFNESFASTLAREGVRRWLLANGEPGQHASYLEELVRENDFLALLGRYRSELQRLYQSGESVTGKRHRKALLIGELRDDYQRLESGWGVGPVYRTWMDGPINNAKLNGVALYHQLVPPLQRQLAEEDGDLALFYRRCRELAELEIGARHRALMPSRPGEAPAGAPGI
jgi:predicted aminopeptidase